MPSRRRRTRKRRPARSSHSRWVEWHTGYVYPGSTVNYTRANLEISTDRPFRLVSVAWDVGCAGVALAQVRIYGPTTASSATASSGPFVVQGRARGILRGNTSWFPNNTSKQFTLFTLDRLCPDQQDKGAVYYSIKAVFDIGSEIVGEQCPSNTLELVNSTAFYTERRCMPYSLDVTTPS